MDSGCPVLWNFFYFLFYICFLVRLCLSQRSRNFLFVYFLVSHLICPLLVPLRACHLLHLSFTHAGLSFWCFGETSKLKPSTYRHATATQLAWISLFVPWQVDSFLLSLLLRASPVWHTLSPLSLSLSAYELGCDFLCCDGDTLCQILCGVCACMPLSLLLLWLLTLYIVPPLVLTPAVLFSSTVPSNPSGWLLPFGSISSSCLRWARARGWEVPLPLYFYLHSCNPRRERGSDAVCPPPFYF